MIETYSIPSYRFNSFMEAINKLAKRAKKLQVTPPTVKVIETYNISYMDHPITGEILLSPMSVEFTKFEMTGEAPKYEGWNFIAKIEHDRDGKHVIYKTPEVELDKQYFVESLAPSCDHCKTKRYRKVTYVVRHDDGMELRVGSTCVKDFLGHNSPANIVSKFSLFFDFFSTVRNYTGINDKVELRYNLTSFLADTHAIIRNYGWVSKKAAQEGEEHSTADRMKMWYEGTLKGIFVIDEDKEMAAKAIEWSQTLDPNKSDFNYNIRTVGQKESINDKQIGIAAAIMGCYINSTFTKTEKVGINSEYIGEVGKRIEFTNAKLLSTYFFHHNFGVKVLYRFLVNDNDIVIWWSSAAKNLDVEAIYTFKATVKEHSIYNNIKQTVVTRAKIANI